MQIQPYNRAVSHLSEMRRAPHEMEAANQARDKKKKAQDAKVKQERAAKRLILDEVLVIPTPQGDPSSRETKEGVASLPDTTGTESLVEEDLTVSLDSSSVHNGTASFQTGSQTTITADDLADIAAPIVASG